ncbi:MAG: GTPase domain-containing protein [Phycisphaerales bacterium]|nr:GTPase domain-containing protein [Phycisphaerales bacterium]
MPERVANLLERSKQWAAQAAAGGWLPPPEIAALESLEHATPADLFVLPERRPLVVALFGGTGVGKSSLLNRLAGAPLAQVGVERPTSREVTIYVHEDIELAELPAVLPLNPQRICRHRRDEYRDVLWLDAPDIDSVEPENRAVALAWLPHVDLVCYVVSPERYRDDAGWRVLLAREHRHGWLFIMNQWDTGDVRQMDDLASMLHAAGFVEPLILRTCCLPMAQKLPSPDEFEDLQRLLGNLVTAHAVRELARRGETARLRDLRAALLHALQRCGADSAWARLRATTLERWGETAGKILTGISFASAGAAARLADRVGVWVHVQSTLSHLAREVAPLRSRAPTNIPLTPGPEANEVDAVCRSLWDEWTQSKLQATIDGLEVDTQHAGLAAQPLRNRLTEVAEGAAEWVATELGDAVRYALARPGTAWQRAARRVTGFLMVFLPAMALVAVGFQVVWTYFEAATGRAAFRGVELAIHSALLVLFAWGVPFWFDRLLRPSIERTVAVALQGAWKSALARLEDALAQAVDEVADTSRQVAAGGRELVAECDRLLRADLGGEPPEPIRRLLSTESVAHATSPRSAKVR